MLIKKKCVFVFGGKISQLCPWFRIWLTLDTLFSSDSSYEDMDYIMLSTKSDGVSRDKNQILKYQKALSEKSFGGRVVVAVSFCCYGICTIYFVVFHWSILIRLLILYRDVTTIARTKPWNSSITHSLYRIFDPTDYVVKLGGKLWHLRGSKVLLQSVPLGSSDGHSDEVSLYPSLQTKVKPRSTGIQKLDTLSVKENIEKE